MHSSFTRKCLIVLSFLALVVCNASAQVQYVSTVPTLNGGNSQSGITFNVKAINQIAIKEIWCAFTNTGSTTVNVYYNPDSISGVPSITTANGWVNLGPVTFNVTSSSAGTAVLIPINNLNIQIAPGATYGFHISSSTNVQYTTGSSGPFVFQDNNLKINTGNTVGYGGSPPSSSFHIRQFNGKIGYLAGPPCPVPTALSSSNILSTSATISWNAVSGSAGYDYVIDNKAIPPGVSGTATTATTANVTGLAPSTKYYYHVRNKCSGGGISIWVTDSFKTLPPCEPPSGFKVSNLMPTSTTIKWDPWLSATSYDYVVDQTTADPGASTSVTNTATTSANITGLTENTKYYVHIRTNCLGNETSNWSLDSFVTPIPCRAPVIKIDHINVSQAVAYWDSVPTANWYEYAITKSSTPPAVGTKYNFTSLHTGALNDGEAYYFHARCFCNSIGIETMSPWGTASFQTFPTAVNNINNKTIGLAAYPNPVNAVLTVAINGNRDADAMLTITDLAGRVVRTERADAQMVNINTAILPSGAYLLKYHDRSNAQVIRLVKQ